MENNIIIRGRSSLSKSLDNTFGRSLLVNRTEDYPYSFLEFSEIFYLFLNIIIRVIVINIPYYIGANPIQSFPAHMRYREDYLFFILYTFINKREIEFELKQPIVKLTPFLIIEVGLNRLSLLTFNINIGYFNIIFIHFGFSFALGALRGRY